MISEIKESQNKDTLVQRLGVFELRGLAREMGIPSPTTKKRDELVSLILENFKNGGNQEVKIQKRGRPYKKLTSLEEIISSVKEPESKGEIQYDSIIRFAQEEAPIFTTRGNSERIEGVARTTDKGVVVYALTSSAKVFVSDVYGAEKLANGDLVELTAQKTGEDTYQALSISLINGVSATSYIKPSEIIRGEEIISNREIPTDLYKIVEGRRNACLLQGDLYENNTLLAICDHAKLTKTTMVLLGTNTSYENQIFFKNFDIKYNFTTPYGTSAAVNLNKTINALNFAENCFNRGENVILVVSDLGGLLMGLDESFNEEDSLHAKETQVIAKKLLSLAGSYATGENFTLVMFYNEIDKDDKFLHGDLLRICKRS